MAIFGAGQGRRVAPDFAAEAARRSQLHRSRERSPMNQRVRRRLTELGFGTLVVLFLPGVASAGWGDENWGEMVWGGGAPAIPSMSLEGRILLALLLLVVSIVLLAKRRGTPMR